MNELLHTLSWPVLAVLHAAVTWYLVGLIWMVQVVHYPLFAAVGAVQFTRYEQDHCRRMGFVVMAPMLLEVALAAWVVAIAPPSVGAWPLVGVGALGAVWASTFFVQVPCHRRLERGFDAAAVRRLVRTNWIRTFAWSVRGVVAAIMLLPPM